MDLIDKILGAPEYFDCQRKGASLRRLFLVYPTTPVVALDVEVAGIDRRLLLKLEGISPWGSIKGRTALGLLASVASRLDGDSVIVESTSGNLGVALAAVGATLGLRVLVVVDSRLPSALRRKLMDYGAQIDTVAPVTNGLNDLLKRIARVRELIDARPRAVWPNQYENPANRLVHSSWTAPEIDQQVEEQVDAIFVAVSTGGTFAGIGEYFAAHRPQVAVVAVDVPGSVALGGTPGPRLLTGIGAGKPSVFLPAGVRRVVVPDAEGITCCHTLAADTGLRVGGSSGASIAGCVRYMASHPHIQRALCICPDQGDNYSETLYEDRWLFRQLGKSTSGLGRLEVDGLPISFRQVA